MYKVCLIFVLLFIFCSDSLAQTVNNLPLSVKITMGKKTKKTKKLVIVAEITNVSKKNIVIDKNSLGYGISYFTDNAMFMSQGESGRGYEGRYLMLSPNESYKNALTISLNDDFFKVPRKYRMNITYGQFLQTQFENQEVWLGTIESNEISFNIRKGKIYL